MKRFLLLLATVICCVAVSAQQDFTIKGYVPGIEDGAVISLFQYEGNVGRSVLTDTVRDHTFSFRYGLEGLQELSIAGQGKEHFGQDYSASLKLWGMPGETITITGNDPYVRLWKVESRIPEQIESDRFIRASLPEFRRKDEMSILEAQIRAQIRSKGKLNAEEMARIKVLQDSLKKEETALNIAIYRNDLEILRNTPVSDIWLNRLKSICSMVQHYEAYFEFRAPALALFGRLSEEQKETPTARQIMIYLTPPEAVKTGDRMADAELKELGGGTRKFSDFLGKYILLDFWSSGCGPCYKSMPELRELQEKYGERLAIIGINLDTSEKSWAQGTEFFGPTWTNLNAPTGNDVTARYAVSGIPHQVMISPEGIILDSWAGYYEGRVEKQLLEYLAVE